MTDTHRPSHRASGSPTTRTATGSTSRIATGGMGEVWRATDTSLGRPVAVKLLKHEYADDPTFRSRFETEARHAAALHHPGVASVYDFGESGRRRADGSGLPRPFLVMELVDGQPLSALLRGGRPLDPDAVRDLLAQAADAIGAAHRAGIVHRDVKPANLLVTPDRQIKITDFGIARASDGLGLTGTGQVMGTPQYLSPEQARGGTATPASDVYSLGVVAFECLAGRRPFEADSPVATALAHLNDPVPDLPPACPPTWPPSYAGPCPRSPTQRYADGDALRRRAARPGGRRRARRTSRCRVPLTRCAERHPGARPACPPTPTPVADARPPDDDRRSPWPLVLLVLALVAAIVLIVVLATNGERRRRRPDRVRHQQRADVVRAHHRGHPERGVELRAGRGSRSTPTTTSAATSTRSPTELRDMRARGRHPAGRQPRRRGGRHGRVGQPDQRPPRATR